MPFLGLYMLADGGTDLNRLVCTCLYGVFGEEGGVLLHCCDS